MPKVSMVTPLTTRTSLVALATATVLTATTAVAGADTDQAPARSRPATSSTLHYYETARMMTGYPGGVIVDRNSRILTAADRKVVIFNATGRRTGMFATTEQGGDLATGPNGDIYLVDFTDEQVLRYNSSGAPQGGWGDPDESWFPTAAAANPTSGQVWITGSVDGDDTVVRVNPNATSIGSSGTGAGQFDNAWSIAYGSGSMYVLDNGNDRVQRFNATTGAYQGKWGQEGYGKGQFEDLKAVATLPDGRVLVLEGPSAEDGDIEVFSRTGSHLGTIPIPVSEAEDIATDKHGNIYVDGLIDYPKGGWGVLKLSPAPTKAARKITLKKVKGGHKRVFKGKVTSSWAPCRPGKVQVRRVKGHKSVVVGHGKAKKHGSYVVKVKKHKVKKGKYFTRILQTKPGGTVCKVADSPKRKVH